MRLLTQFQIMQFQTYINPHLDGDDDRMNNWVVSKPRLHLNLVYMKHHHRCLNQHKGQDKNG